MQSWTQIRVGARRPLMLGLALAASLLAPAAASARTILMQSTPFDHGMLPPGAQELVLRYDGPIDHARSRLTLAGTNAEMDLPLEPNSPPDSLAAKLDLSPGVYTVHWQVLAVDGALSRGDLHFTVPDR